ncbi:MAG TPA: response regulator [Noviherbaspirillum sp.]|nr:response regulator [Noviherbaspirillum sp.]
MSPLPIRQPGAPRILIVDDEPAIVDLLKFTIDKAGWDATLSYSATEAWELMQRQDFSLVLLDWMLPDLSGYHLLSRIRGNRRTEQLPVIMLTARGMEEDRVAGLDNGADDYVTKPFSPRELTSRINALMRRQGPADPAQLLRAGTVTLDAASVTVTIDNERAEMGHAEFKLLKFFMSHPERVFSRSQLLDKVWGDHVVIEERTVDVHVLRLRKALKGQEHLIRTVRGVGYMLTERL